LHKNREKFQKYIAVLLKFNRRAHLIGLGMKAFNVRYSFSWMAAFNYNWF